MVSLLDNSIANVFGASFDGAGPDGAPLGAMCAFDGVDVRMEVYTGCVGAAPSVTSTVSIAEEATSSERGRRHTAILQNDIAT